MRPRLSATGPPFWRSTRTSTSTHPSAFETDDIWFICVGCGKSTNSAWGRKPGYPQNSCLDCGERWVNGAGSVEDPSERRTPATATSYPTSHNATPDDTASSRSTIILSLHEDLDDREASPQSIIVVSTAESGRLEGLERDSTAVPDDSLSFGVNGPNPIERLRDLYRNTAALQEEQLKIIDGISDFTKHLVEKQEHDRIKYATLREENNRLQETNQTLCAECDGLTSKCEKLEAKLQKLNQARLELMMMEGSDKDKYELFLSDRAKNGAVVNRFIH